MFEIRRSGKLIHREADEAKATAWATANLGGLEGVSVEPGRLFEVYADGGVAETFDSIDEAWAYARELESHQAPKRTPSSRRGFGRGRGEMVKRFEQVEVRTMSGEVVAPSAEPEPEETVPETETDPAPAMETA